MTQASMKGWPLGLASGNPGRLGAFCRLRRRHHFDIDDGVTDDGVLLDGALGDPGVLPR